VEEPSIFDHGSADAGCDG